MQTARGWISATFPANLVLAGLGHFDLVTSMEVIEHVEDKQAFIVQLAAHLAPEGLMVLSTPNRTLKSRTLLVGAAEAVGAVPKGTHHWEDFVTPEELEALLRDAGWRWANPKALPFLLARACTCRMIFRSTTSSRHAIGPSDPRRSS